MRARNFKYLAVSLGGTWLLCAHAGTTEIWKPTVFGGAANELQPAASMESVGANEYNHYTVCFGVTNTSVTNELRNWVLPSAERIFAFRVFDKNGRPLKGVEYDPPALEPLAANMSLLYFGKNALSDTDGVAAFLAHTASQISKFNLDEFVQIPKPGEYRLELVERLYQIAADGKLVPVLFPPVNIDLHIIDQLSETALLLNQSARDGKLYWSETIDSIRVGVQQTQVGESSNENQTQFEVFAENLGYQEIRDYRMPKVQEQFDISLVGPDGKDVPKTALGKQRGLPLQIKDSSASLSEFFVDGPRPTGTRAMYVPARDASIIGRFNLLELFEIKKPGKYIMRYQQRFYQMDPTIRPAPITWPVITYPFELHDPIDIHTTAPE